MLVSHSIIYLPQFVWSLLTPGKLTAIYSNYKTPTMRQSMEYCYSWKLKRSSMSTYLNAFSCCPVIGWLDICVNKQLNRWSVSIWGCLAAIDPIDHWTDCHQSKCEFSDMPIKSKSRWCLVAVIAATVNVVQPGIKGIYIFTGAIQVYVGYYHCHSLHNYITLHSVQKRATIFTSSNR